MQTTDNIAPDIEKVLAEIEGNLLSDSEKLKPHALVRIVWKCSVPADALPLLDSLFDTEMSHDRERIQSRHMRFLPVILRYADSINLRLTVSSDAGSKTFHALEPFGIDIRQIRKTGESGTLALGDSPDSLRKPENVNEALSVLLELLFDAPDDLGNSVESVVFEAPVERLRTTEIFLNPVEVTPAPDVLWIIATPEQLQNKKIDLFYPATDKSKHPVVLPMAGLSPVLSADSQNDFKDTAALPDILHHADIHFKETQSAVVFPVVPFYNEMLPDYIQIPESYMRFCLDLMWKTTETFIQSTNAPEQLLAERYETVVSAVMRPPETILGLLHQRSYLLMLQPLQEIKKPSALPLPDKALFTELQDKGSEQFTVLLRKITEEIQKKAEPKVSPLEPVASQLIQFCDQFVNAESLAEEQPCITKLIGEIRKSKSAVEKQQLNGYFTEIETILDTAEKRASDCGKEAAVQFRNLEKLPTPEIDPEIMENSEQVQLFWTNIMPASLKKVKIKRPDKTAIDICSKTQREFDEFLSLTPNFDEEFEKCRDNVWPEYAEKCMGKINDLLKESVNIWQLTLNQELDNLEEFREEKIPQGPKINSNISVKTGKIPVLKERLDIKIKKKPGKLTKLFSASVEDDSWRKETIMSFKKAGNAIFALYQSDIVNWLNTASDSMKEIIKGKIDSAQSAAEAEKRRIEILQKKIKAEITERKRLLSELKHTVTACKNNRSSAAGYKQEWNRLKQELSETIRNLS